MANMLALVTSVMHIKHTEESSKHSLLCLHKQEWYGTKLLFFFYYFYMVPHGRKLSTVVKFLKKQFLWTRQVHILFFFNIIWNALTIPIYLSRCIEFSINSEADQELLWVVTQAQHHIPATEQGWYIVL